MKPLQVLLLTALMSLVAAAQDTAKHDPLVDPWGRYPSLANSVEIVSITDSITAPSNNLRFPRIVDFNSSNTLLEEPPSGVDMSTTPNLGSDRWIDCATGDFDGDFKDEILLAWEDAGGYIHLEWGGATRLKPSYDWQWNQNQLYPLSWWGDHSQIRLVPINLDGVPPSEFLVCRVVPDYNMLVVTALQFDSTTHQFTQLLEDVYTGGYPYDLAAGDLNGDGRDEIMHVYYHFDGTYRHMVIARYNYDPATRKFSYVGEDGRTGTEAQWATWKRLKITMGDFQNVGHDDAVVSLTLTSGNSGHQVFNYITYWGSGYPQFGFNLPGVSPTGWSWGNGWESDAVAVDINPYKDDGDELVVAGPGEVAILKFNSSLQPYYVAGGAAKLPFLYSNALESRERRRFLAVGDMDPDTSAAIWVPEIVVAEHKQDSTTVFRILTPTVDEGDNITGLTQKAVLSPGRKSVKSEIAVGDFDGDAMRLGAPRLVAIQNFYQPIVMLNVPPTHFDFLGGQIYDVCKVHTASPSEFKVTYTEKQSQTSHFESQVNHSWGASAEISGGFKAFGFKVSAYAKTAYEGGYYASHTADTTTTASQVTESSLDDWVLATLSDIDFWEYPVHALGRQVGNFLVQIPHFKGTQWFPSRNAIARDWMADREVGNLFSYLPASKVSSWANEDLLTTFTGKYVSIASGGSWTLDLATGTIDESKLKHNVGVEVGASVARWGVEAKVSGKYSYEQIKTHTSTATKDVLIDVKVSDTDKTFGETDYLVTPYVYWGRNGALVVDYGVDPSSTGDPVLGTFWDQKYSTKPDPALILPWRLDSLKGIGGTGNIRLYCKSLHISPMVSAAGDTVHITVNVHNYSLKEMTGPVSVRFYLGNPTSGGVPIVGTLGETEVTSSNPIPARDRVTLEMDWLVPSGLDNSARVYAAIDPDNLINEIHEDNNVGFVPLRASGTVDVDEEEKQQAVPSSYFLAQNYPNPFNPSTVIQYDLPTRSHVTLTVYDLLGRSVASLVSKIQDAGCQHVVFDGRGLATGVYVYRLIAQPAGAEPSKRFVSIKKMLIVR